MPFNDGKRYCPDCGREMKPLSQTFFCPNDCDRIPALVLTEITERINTSTDCPKCKSVDTVAVTTWGWCGYKCLDCAHHFNV